MKKVLIIGFSPQKKMNKKKTIRIKNFELKTFWYAKRIGEIFDVKKSRFYDWYVVLNLKQDNGLKLFIKKRDAEIL